MSDKFDRLINLLRELFQLDQPDLDFGLYRIMHAKSGEVTQFLEKDLLPQVRKAFEQYQPADKAAVKKKLDEAVAAAESLGVDPDTNEKVKELRAELDAGIDLEALESEVYDHLFSFFRRYYSDGDFLAKRVYKRGVYAVPYQGEEVVLHWANKDQYYIKTSEYLRDYAFRIKPKAGDAGGDPMRVHFRLVAAAEGEHGVNKAAEGKDRVFVLANGGESGHDFLNVETIDGSKELVIGFEYRPATMDDWADEAKADATAAAKKKPPKQKVLHDIAVKAVLAVSGGEFEDWVRVLEKPHIKVNGETADYSCLAGHLSRYYARHTFDYFIHKNLGGFLRRELDFYIKNEVMHLDDVQHEDAPKVEQYLSKIKVIRTIAGKVIDFLHQLEEFQRKLWLKKKFVTDTFYCIRLDVIPREFYADIAANDGQRLEWIDLCGIDTTEKDLAGPGYSTPLTVEFLESQPTLVMDTKHFPSAFVARLLDSLDDLDEQTDGLVIQGDNYNAMRLIQPAFQSSIKSVYLDPPYNTGSDGFVYKDTYQHSTWASMMADRLQQCHTLLSSSGSVLCSIDDKEHMLAMSLLASTFGSANHIGTVIWKGATDNNPTRIAVEHEYVPCFVKSRDSCEAHWSTSDDAVKQMMLDAFDRCKEDAADEQDLIARFNEWVTEHRDEITDLYRYRRVDSGGPYAARRNMDNPGKPGHTYDVIHPVTGRACSKPTWGWRFKEETMAALLAEDRILFGEDENKIPELKVYLKDVRFPLRSVLRLDARKGSNNLDRLFGSRAVFKNPKPVELLTELLPFVTADDSWVLDCFAGSGTTAQAVIELNREHGRCCKFLLIEMGDHFDTVMLPRLKKLVFAPEWSDGKATRQPTDGEREHSPRVIRGIRLESYEDAIANLLIHRDGEHSDLLSSSDASVLAEQYLLRYMLDTETRDSPSLLNIAQFSDPTCYTLTAKSPWSDESKNAPIDLVETFNWLLGLRVRNLSQPMTFDAGFERDDEKRLLVKDRIKEDPDASWWFRTVAGTTPDGKRALIIWRKRPGGDDPEGIEQDNAVLDAWFRTQRYSTTDSEFDIVWVNGDNNLANLRQEEASEEGLDEAGWKVRVIEQDFHQLMFDTSDVSGGA